MFKYKCLSLSNVNIEELYVGCKYAGRTFKVKVNYIDPFPKTLFSDGKFIMAKMHNIKKKNH